MFTKENLWFLIRWVFLTIIAYILGRFLPLIPLIAICVDCGSLYNTFTMGILPGILAGFLISIFQYLIIRKRIGDSEEWFRTSFLGWAFVFSIQFSVEYEIVLYKANFTQLLIVWSIGFLGVLIIGWLQWKTVLKKDFIKSWIWIPISCLSMGVGLALDYHFRSGYVDYAETTYALFTGLALVYLLQPKLKKVE